MDASADVFYGPSPVQKIGTVSVPRQLLEEIGVVAGEGKVLWALNPDLPGTLILIPATLMARGMPGAFDALRQAGS